MTTRKIASWGLFIRHGCAMMRVPSMNEETDTWTKFGCRRSIRAHLGALTDEDLRSSSERILMRLQMGMAQWGPPGVVALYGGLRAEPDLVQGLLPWLCEQGWRSVLFSVEGKDLVPREVSGIQNLRRGALGVWEPLAEMPRVPSESLTVILVPGLAFDAQTGARLGRGGGFYDRFLARDGVRARRIGVAMELQVLPSIPQELHDARVDELVTEAAWRKFHVTSPVQAASRCG